MKRWKVENGVLIIGEDHSDYGWFIRIPLVDGIYDLYEYCDGTEPRYFGQYDTLEEALAAAKTIT